MRFLLTELIALLITGWLLVHFAPLPPHDGSTPHTAHSEVTPK